MKILVCMTDDELAGLCEKTGRSCEEIAYFLDNYESLSVRGLDSERFPLDCPIEIVVV